MPVFSFTTVVGTWLATHDCPDGRFLVLGSGRGRGPEATRRYPFPRLRRDGWLWYEELPILSLPDLAPALPPMSCRTHRRVPNAPAAPVPSQRNRRIQLLGDKGRLHAAPRHVWESLRDGLAAGHRLRSPAWRGLISVGLTGAGKGRRRGHPGLAVCAA